MAGNKQLSDQLQGRSKLEIYFEPFRNNIIGIDQDCKTPYGIKKITYADWTASGRLYRPIEEKMAEEIGPYTANTHTQTSTTGAVMTLAYEDAREIIKKHVNASSDDVLVMEGTGMTGAVNKLQRILGLKISESLSPYTNVPEELRPVVFITHMEHHSNHTSWLETIARVEIIPADAQGLPSIEALEKLCIQYKNVPLKIASVTSCSNVTGIKTDYHGIARMLHQYGGKCFVDFACSAPYVSIDMHPDGELEYLDGIFFSPHKFLGGPGSSGVLIFSSTLYKNLVPDNPGGGTVSYTNPWGAREYIDDIESREDGGTPGFLQTIKTALAIRLKEKMGVQNILDREEELNSLIIERLVRVANLKLLASEHKARLGIFSFYVEHVHYNLIVRLLNDRFGIQTRGGCSCAGTYGHYLLAVDEPQSNAIKEKIVMGNLLERPGWIRMSVHPTMTNVEVLFICEAIKNVADNAGQWGMDYTYNPDKNCFIHKDKIELEAQIIKNWFTI